MGTGQHPKTPQEVEAEFEAAHEAFLAEVEAIPDDEVQARVDALWNETNELGIDLSRIGMNQFQISTKVDALIKYLTTQEWFDQDACDLILKRQLIINITGVLEGLKPQIAEMKKQAIMQGRLQANGGNPHKSEFER